MKTQDLRNWMVEVFHALSTDANQAALADLRSNFDQSKQFYFIRLVHYIPEKKYRAKNGNLKTPDITNIEKPLIDLIFDKKYHDKKPPFGCPNLNMNDASTAGMLTWKKPTSGAYYIKVDISIHETDKLMSQIQVGPQLQE